MKPAILDIDFTQQNDYSITVTFVDSNGSALDYHLLTFTGHVKEQPDSTTSWSFTVDQTAAASGVVVFSLANTQTDDMPDVVEYELRMSSSTIFTFMAGAARIRRSLFV